LGVRDTLGTEVGGLVEIVAAIALTQPGFGILPAAQSLPRSVRLRGSVRLVEARFEDDGDDG
jgi:hypothetical protein